MNRRRRPPSPPLAVSACLPLAFAALEGDRSGKSSIRTSCTSPPTSLNANTGSLLFSLHSLQTKVIARLAPLIVSFLSSSTLFLPSTCAKVLVQPGHLKRWATSPLISAALTCLLVSLAILLWLMVCFAKTCEVITCLMVRR